MTKTDAGGGLGRASALLASGTIVSRILGFVSAAVLAQAIGTTGAGADTFAIANQLPNNIYAIIAGGLLSAVLVPQIVKAGMHDDGGQRFINRLVTLGLAVFVLAAVIATIAAPLLVDLYSQQSSDGSRGLSPDEIALATAFAYWCLPQVLFYAIYSLLGEVLNARKIFGPFTWTPVLNNLVAIAGMVVFIVAFGGDPAHTDASTWTAPMITLLAGSATLGIAVQGLGLFWFWRRAGLTYRPDFHWRGVGLGATGKAASWVFGMIVITQLAGIVQSNVASQAGGSGDASVRVLGLSWLIFMLPHSIVAVSIATAYYTRMSTHAHEGNLDGVRADFSASMRSIGLIMVFASAGLIVLAFPFSAVFDNDFDDVQQMGYVVIAYLVGLVPFSILFLIQRTFYSLGDTRTPFFLQVFQSALFVLGALVVSGFEREWIAVGIAAVTSIAGSAQAVVAAVMLRRRLQRIDAARILRRYATFLLAALPTAAVGALLASAMGVTTDGGFAVSDWFTALVSMVVIGGVMALVYAGVLVAFRNPELGEAVRPVVRRLRGRG
ncbi:lipid II flippase MurJ [Conyzicola nivalis]|uniref:Lipid II flippase MurJ n=1 Tax=Conyzicola nivalis TaxID=1477021 RepID=A0A916WK25_9MICO|nr:murein biosynthesis integral membrane protein MurJ [Conyzicola nivalis]GGB08850.1 lipid II flippase MurJ [Conyzicola nivalis]